MVKGGNAPNSVPALCNATIDIRIVPGMSPEGVLSELKELAHKVKRQGIDFIFTIIQKTYPSEVQEDAPIINAIKRFVPHAETIGIGGGTFCHDLRNKGVDAVGWSPGSHSVVHMAQEHISIQ